MTLTVKVAASKGMMGMRMRQILGTLFKFIKLSMHDDKGGFWIQVSHIVRTDQRQDNAP